jgi:ribosome-binding protein aMBF1 (putative translation factor)
MATFLRVMVENLAINLRKYRRQMELTQAELAARAAMHVDDVRKMERGQFSPTLLWVESLALALNLGDAPWVLLLPAVKRRKQ